MTSDHVNGIILAALIGQMLAYLWSKIDDYRRRREEERGLTRLPHAKSTYWPWNKGKRK